MKWRQVNKHYAQSGCGMFRITWGSNFERGPFVLWRTTKGRNTDVPAQIGVFFDKDRDRAIADAKAVAEKYID